MEQKQKFKIIVKKEEEDEEHHDHDHDHEHDDDDDSDEAYLQKSMISAGSLLRIFYDDAGTNKELVKKSAEEILLNSRVVQIMKSCLYRKKIFNAIEKLSILNKKRRRIMQELYTTEESYLKILNELNDLFAIPFQELVFIKVVEQKDYDLIFGIVPQLITFHTEFLKQINNVVNIPQNRTLLSNAFLKYLPAIKSLYKQFVVNKELAGNRLQKLCETSSEFSNWLTNVGKGIPGKLDGKDLLEHLWITPVQRIPRYELLVNEIIKNTNKEYDDFEDLTKTKAEISKVTSYINEEKRKTDSVMRLDKIKRHSSQVTLVKHDFVEEKLKEPVVCGVCHDHIWGFSRKAFICSECDLSVHKKCKKAVKDSIKCRKLSTQVWTDEEFIAERKVQFFTEDLIYVNPKAKKLMGKMPEKEASICIFNKGLGIADVVLSQNEKHHYTFLAMIAWSSVTKVTHITNTSKKGAFRICLAGKDYFDFCAIDDIAAGEIISFIKKTKESFKNNEN